MPGRRRHRQERQAVVARIAAEEAQPRRRAVGRTSDHLRRQPHRVAQPEAEHVAVEAQRGFVVLRRQHDVAEALLAGDEAVPVRADDAAVLQRHTVERLERVAGRVVEADQLDDLAVGELVGRALLVRHAGRVEPVADVLQLGGVRASPSRWPRGGRARRARSPAGPGSRPCAGTARRRSSPCPRPCRGPSGRTRATRRRRSPRCAGSRAIGRVISPPRTPRSSALNSSNFSSMAQCPQPPNTCSCARGISLSAASAPSSGLTRSSRPQTSSTRCRSLYASRHSIASSAAPGRMNDMPIAFIDASVSGSAAYS